MTIEKITRPICKILREEINKKLVEVGQTYGLKISAGNASYTDNSVTFKVECLLSGFDKAKENFEHDCFMFKLPADAYEKTFMFNAKQWRLVGLKPRSPKFPIIASRVGQKGNYKLPERAVAELRS